MSKVFILCTMFAATVGFTTLATAQTIAPGENGATYFHRCGNAEYEEYLRSKDPMYDIKKQEIQNVISKKTEEMEKARLGGNPVPLTLFTIPVVFHVVYNCANAAVENLSDQQVLYAFTQLNLDWSRTNSDTGNTPAVWKPIAADMQLRYCLASKDPSGNPTTGIIHKATTATSFTTDDKVKSSASGGDDAWDTHKYLNIWICNLGGGLLGYGAFLPITNTWGTVVHYITIGSLTHPSAAGGVYGYGRTLSHEIGHCFNLYHIWGNVNSGCSGNSDAISDTPSMDGPTSGCPSGVVTSSGCAAGTDGSPASNVAPGRMYQNYMDYTDDMCYNMFTAKQRIEVQNAIQNYLTTVANNSSVACNSPALDASIVSVSAPNGTYCTNTIVPVAQLQNFGKDTLTSCNINYQIDANPASTYNWTGTLSPYGSTNVTLPSMSIPVGSHTFTINSSDPNGSTDGNPSNDQTQSLLNVMSSTPSLQPPYIEGFENSGFPYADCYLTPTKTAQWNTTSSASYAGGSSMMLDNFSQTSANVYEFITPAIDMSNVITPSMTFWLAHAQLNSTDADKLIVFTSTNCGSTWTQHYSKIGATLANAGVVSTAFIPSSSSQWRLETVSIPNVIGQSDVRFKFQFTSKCDGNNIYVDDINISDVNGVNEEFSDGFNLNVFPNPFNDNATISFNILEKYSVSIGIFDIVGREVLSVSPKKEISAGRYSLPLNRNALKSGIYFVKLNVNGYSVMKKVIVQ